MNKGELIERLAEEARVTKGEAQKYFEAFVLRMGLRARAAHCSSRR
jgi:nucleoid DNA-binding protein